jgi:hypothetical protein
MGGWDGSNSLRATLSWGGAFDEGTGDVMRFGLGLHVCREQLVLTVRTRMCGLLCTEAHQA